jgi:UPF0755 protein
VLEPSEHPGWRGADGGGRERSPRRALAVLGIIALVMLLILGAGGIYYVYASGASGDQAPVSLEIPTGSTPSGIASLLHEKGVIRSAFMFRLMVKLRGLADTLKAGTYELKTNMTLNEVLDALKEGPAPVPTVTFGFPEGLRVDEIATRAAKDLGLARKGFLKVVTGKALSLPPYLPEGTPTLEGFLFPKVYEFLPEPTAQTVVQKMLDQFETEVGGLDWAGLGTFGVSEYEAVVVASLIEREARVDEDRGKIARVIYNRLKIGQALEIDATIQYALGENRPITNDDKAIDSPYNTYQHTGLTPTPICSPGLKSIQAALSPTPGEWLYYLTVDDSGRHEFFNTYEEFLNALHNRG